MLSRLRGQRSAPRLSVVVPVYNVESYVAECLDSILAQTFKDLEVILVDDGSTDGSAAIVAKYADRHPNWKLIRTGNNGLGAARNRGVQEAQAEYLAFVDSDDLLPDYAYRLMVSTLDESGSDFVVGSVQQLFDGVDAPGDKLTEPEFLRPGVERRRIGVRAADVPPIIRNVFAWNKVFRRSFYERAEIRFPEGVRYEDQPATMRAYLLADRFDIVRRPVYTWRIRSDRSSITQGRGQLADLEDRLTTKRLTTEVVRSFGDEKILDFWGRLALVGDLPVYLRQIPTADDAYWDGLVTGLRDMLGGFPPIEQSMLRLPQRLVGWLVVRDRRADAERVLRWLDEHPGPLSLRVEGNHVVGSLPFVDDPSSGIPAELFWLGDHELEFDARLQTVHWEGNSLVVSGIALIRGAPTDGVGCRIRVVLRSSTGAEIPLDVIQRTSPEATEWVSRPPQRYDDCGFEARVDLSDAARSSAGSGLETSTWSIDLEIEVADIRRRGGFRSKDPDIDIPANEPDLPGSLAFKPGEGLFVTLPV